MLRLHAGFCDEREHGCAEFGRADYEKLANANQVNGRVVQDSQRELAADLTDVERRCGLTPRLSLANG